MVVEFGEQSVDVRRGMAVCMTNTSKEKQNRIYILQVNKNKRE